MSSFSGIYNSAMSQYYKVADAKTACQSASSSLNSIITSVQNSWTGPASDAYVEKLRTKKQELDTIASNLSAILSTMQAQANAVTNSWPNEVASLTATEE